MDGRLIFRLSNYFVWGGTHWDKSGALVKLKRQDTKSVLVGKSAKTFVGKVLRKFRFIGMIGLISDDKKSFADNKIIGLVPQTDTGGRVE